MSRVLKPPLTTRKISLTYCFKPRILRETIHKYNRKNRRKRRSCRISEAEILWVLSMLSLSPLVFSNLIQIALRGLGFIFWVFSGSLGRIWVKGGFYRHRCPKLDKEIANSGLVTRMPASWPQAANATVLSFCLIEGSNLALRPQQPTLQPWVAACTSAACWIFPVLLLKAVLIALLALNYLQINKKIQTKKINNKISKHVQGKWWLNYDNYALLSRGATTKY